MTTATDTNRQSQRRPGDSAPAAGVVTEHQTTLTPDGVLLITVSLPGDLAEFARRAGLLEAGYRIPPSAFLLFALLRETIGEAAAAAVAFGDRAEDILDALVIARIGRTPIHRPYPELIDRDDERFGPWTITSCEPRRGSAGASVADRILAAPTGDEERCRVIRAHELMHVRISPGRDWAAWLARGEASEAALRAAEEFRVNWLCARAGFAIRRSLADGREQAVGVDLARTGSWRAAVLFAAVCAGTAAMEPFLVGIGTHRPEWVAALRSVEELLHERARTIDVAALTDTGVAAGIGLAPAGFAVTETWAAALDALAAEPPPTAYPSAQPAAPSEPLQPAARHRLPCGPPAPKLRPTERIAPPSADIVPISSVPSPGDARRGKSGHQRMPERGEPARVRRARSHPGHRNRAPHPSQRSIR